MALGASTTTTTNDDIILGNPIYTEIDKATNQKSIVVNGTTTAHATEVTFSGHGTAKDVNYTDNGKALVMPRDNGQAINTKGHVVIMTNSGEKASADFQEIGHVEYNNKGIITATGTAFFDANATGKLAFLGNAVAIYKDQIYKDGTDKLEAWQWK
jgi:sorbitol-specific phosphotransferase system component IIA